MPKKIKVDIHQQVTDKIIELIKSGGLSNWKKNWNGESPFFPKNAQTKNYYSGINVLLLASEMIGGKYSENLWCTFKQAQKLGYKVKKGSKGTSIVFYKKIEVDDETVEVNGETGKKEIFFLKYSTVFNVEQLEGYESKISTTTKASFTESPELETIINNAKKELTIKHEGNMPCFIPSLDMVKMPSKKSFNSEGAYYATFLHELGHATGAENRLDRDMNSEFGDKGYAFEELIAELASAFVSARIGVVGEEIENHASYIASWLKGLKDDKKAIFKAASQAQKASDYIIDNWSDAALKDAA